MNKDLKQKIDEVVANMGNQDLSDKLMAEAFALAVTPQDKKEAGREQLFCFESVAVLRSAFCTLR